MWAPVSSLKRLCWAWRLHLVKLLAPLASTSSSRSSWEPSQACLRLSSHRWRQLMAHQRPTMRDNLLLTMACKFHRRPVVHFNCQLLHLVVSRSPTINWRWPQWRLKCRVTSHSIVVSLWDSALIKLSAMSASASAFARQCTGRSRKTG